MYYKNYYQKGDRFVIPFLFGALAGGATASLVGPRPVFVNPPMTQVPVQPVMPFNPGMPYGYTQYSYYHPNPPMNGYTTFNYYN